MPFVCLVCGMMAKAIGAYWIELNASPDCCVKTNCQIGNKILANSSTTGAFHPRF